MADTLSITLAQLNQSAGDIAGNAAAMLAARDRARDAGADLIAFPEMQLIGYPPEDLILKPALIERAARELQAMAKVTADGGPAMLVGSVFVRDGNLHNGVALLDGGKVAEVRLKRELPTTALSTRYACPNPARCPNRWYSGGNDRPANLRGHLAARRLPPPRRFRRRNADLHQRQPLRDRQGHAADRRRGQAPRGRYRPAAGLSQPRRRAGRTGVRRGKLCGQRRWQSGRADGRLDRAGSDHPLRTDIGWRCEAGEIAPLADHPEDIYCAMVMALRDYVDRNRFPGVVLGRPAGSTARSAPPSPPTRWGRSGCGA